MPLFSGTSTTSGITTTNASEKGGREVLRKGGLREVGQEGGREGMREGGRKQWMEEGGMNVIQGKEEIHTNTNN